MKLPSFDGWGQRTRRTEARRGPPYAPAACSTDAAGAYEGGAPARVLPTGGRPAIRYSKPTYSSTFSEVTFSQAMTWSCVTSLPSRWSTMSWMAVWIMDGE